MKTRCLASCAGTLGLSALLLSGCGPTEEPPPTFHPSTPQEAAALTYFQETVKPELRQNCYRCHFGLNHKGGFNLSTRDLLLKGGKHGPAVIPGSPDGSLLLRLVRHQGPPEHPMNMPPKGQLSPEEVAVIAKWIADGAVMDR